MKISVSVDRVLKAKMDPVKESFSILCENGTYVDSMKFVDYLMKQQKNVIQENVSYLYKIPNTTGVSCFNAVIESSNDLPIATLTKLHDDLVSYIDTLPEATLEENAEWNNQLCEAKELLENKIEYRNTTESIRDNINMEIIKDRFNSVYEDAYLADDLAIIAYNVNYNYEVVDDYERIIRKIKMSETDEYFSDYPMILENNTSIILNLNRQFTGPTLQLFISLPKILADKLISASVSKTIAKNMIKVFDIQVKRIAKDAKSSHVHYAMMSHYLDELRNSKELLNEYVRTFNQKKYVYENIAEMQPDIIQYDDELSYIESELESTLIDILVDDSDDDVPYELLENLSVCIRRYEMLVEAGAVGTAAVKTSTKIASKAQKISNKMTDAGKTVSRVGTATKQAVSPIINKISDIVDTIKKKDRDERTEYIITGKRYFTLLRMLRKALRGIVIGGALKGAAMTVLPGFAGPIIGLISIITGMAIDNTLDLRERKRISLDLQQELKIIDEKIDDAKGAGDTKAKYELMRVRNKLERDLNRVRFRLDHE